LVFRSANDPYGDGMTNVVNLRLVRKRKARADKEAQAAANRRKHGEAKASRSRRKAEKAREESRLDGKKFD